MILAARIRKKNFAKHHFGKYGQRRKQQNCSQI